MKKDSTFRFTAIYNRNRWYFRSYDGRKREFKGITRKEFEEACKKAIARRDKRASIETKSLLRRCYEAVVKCADPSLGSYMKVPMYGHTHLWLCSPVYGHSDYNKSRLIEIQGNEAKCEFLIKVAERVQRAHA